MHTHSEIVIPPTTNIAEAVADVLKPFDENDDENNGHAFWDFFVIGGRFAGHKLVAQFNAAKVDEFYEWCKAEKITVAGVQCGKQSLSPETQIPKVDAKWNEMFPSPSPMPCPLFNHANDQYARNGKLSGALPGDVLRLAEVPPTLGCSRVIFAKPSYETSTKDWTGPLQAEFMLCDSQWNGCNHMKIDWDGRFQTALDKYRDSLKDANEDYVAKISPTDDWLVVTIDSHS